MSKTQEDRGYGFGLIPCKAEGSPQHPDWWGIGYGGPDFTDQEYLRHLQNFADYWGEEETRRIGCSRPELMDRVDFEKAREEARNGPQDDA